MLSTLTEGLSNDSSDADRPRASDCIRISLCFPPLSMLRPHSSSMAFPQDSKISGEQLTFRPLYTHQCFENESLYGWRPLVDIIQPTEIVDTKANRKIKESKVESCNIHTHQIERVHHVNKQCLEENDRIDVHILLSPSCNSCHIEVNTTCSEQFKPPCKKMKVSFKEENHPENSSPKLEIKRLNISDIVSKVSLASPPILSVYVNGTTMPDWLPKSVAEVRNNFNSYLNAPIGRTIKSYYKRVKDLKCDNTTETKFIITIAKGSDRSVSHYHGSIQKLARWFIETADDVDISRSERAGFWNVLYLFREHTLPPEKNEVDDEQANDNVLPAVIQYSLAGYITLFHFNAPFKIPRGGIIARVCQAFILPPYQRSGHGSKLLQTVYDYAAEYATCYSSEAGMEIVEVNIEDPSPRFTALRDIVDYQRFSSLLSSHTASEFNSMYLTNYSVVEKDYFSPIPEEKLLTVASLLKVTKRQAQIMHEIYKLEQVEKWKQHYLDEAFNMASSMEKILEVETNYRLMVKKSLKVLRLEELGGCNGKEEQKALLEVWFQETLCHYRKLLGCRKYL